MRKRDLEKNQAKIKEMISLLAEVKTMDPKPPKKEELLRKFEDWRKKARIA